MSWLTNVTKILTGTSVAEKQGIGLEHVRQSVAGVDTRVPVYDGRSVPYVNLDNAATTPPFVPVLETIDSFRDYYSSIHRGTGFKSLLSTHLYERCREIIASFVGADPSHHAVLFTQNATYALNKLARRLPLSSQDVVVITLMEHHSNVLPWRLRGCQVVTAAIRRGDGALDLQDLAAKLRQHSGRVKVVSVTGGSNVTGNMPRYRHIARLAHEHGAWFVVDGTQLAPHRPVQMGAPDDPERIDFLAFSGHKMYAPFGCGVLVGPREVFEKGPPDVVGGGTVHAVTAYTVVWNGLPEKEEAGTPNVIGALALARAAKAFEQIGMDNLVAHERELARYCLRKLRSIQGLRIFGRKDPELRTDRLGIFALDADGLGHGLLAAALGYEWGIGTRNGCFCAQPYVRELLGISPAEMGRIVKKLVAGDHTTVPGLVRVSLGIYNTREEIDYLTEALQSIVRDGPRARYVLDPRHLDYVPEDYAVDYDDYLPL